MKEIKTFGIPVYIDEKTSELCFPEGVMFTVGKKKRIADMKGLLYDDAAADGSNEVCYQFYSDIVRAEDRPLFEKTGFVNGITVLQPGTMHKECRKNSGHFHGFAGGHTLPFPEIYEVLAGKAVFLLAKSTNFNKLDEELKIDECKAVFLNEGEKFIVPPFTAHCASNVGEGPMVFGNFAAPCPLLYKPIRDRHGLCYYILKEKGNLIFVTNSHYHYLPQLRIAEAQENPDLGITFVRSVYESFVTNPHHFDYLSNPEPYVEQIRRMLI